MIEGVVSDALEAVVALSIQGPSGPAREITAVVDTGYSGFLTLPGTLATELELPFAYIGRAVLANDDEVSFDVHDVTVIWDDRPREIKADVTGSVSLLGMAMLDGYDLNIQVKSGGRVVVQPIE